MRFDASLTRAECTFGNLSFHAGKKGFWSTSIQISLPDGQAALFATTENWFSTTETLHCGTKEFKIRWQNNPLAELIIYETDRKYPLLTIGLKTEGGYAVTRFQVTEAARQLPQFPYLLAYAWCAFLPASQGDDVALATLLCSVA